MYVLFQRFTLGLNLNRYITNEFVKYQLYSVIDLYMNYNLAYNSNHKPIQHPNAQNVAYIIG